MVETSGDRNRRDFKATSKLVALVALGLLLLVFMALNSTKVPVDLVVLDFMTRLFVVVIGAALVGVVIGFLLAKILDRRQR